MRKENGKSTKYRNTGKPPYRGKRSEGDDKFDSAKSNKSTMNDPAWYATNAQLLSDSASLAYSQAIGTYDKNFGSVVPIDRIDAATWTTKASKLVAAPGMMTIRLAPTIGISNNNVSTVNIAATRLYSWVRHANAGSKNYDSPDLMMYLLAMDSIYSYYSYIVRALGVCRLYSQKNRYMSDSVLTALGVIPSSLQDNFAAARNKLNMLGAKMAALCIPSTMSYFIRHAWLYQNIYKDSPTEKSQMYAFVPDGFYKYDGFSDPTGGKLVYTKINTAGPSTIQVHLANLEAMLNAVVADEDINIMSGDILKAYGAGELVIVGQVSEEFLLLPVYDEEVLSQIQNITVMQHIAISDITQDATGAILSVPKVGSITPTEVNFANPGSKRITIRKDVVTPADTMVATRLTYPIIDIKKTMVGQNYPISSCGSEIATLIELYNFAETAVTPTVFLARTSCGLYTTLGATGSDTALDKAAQLSEFDWHPEFIFALEGTTGIFNQVASAFDIDNYTIVTANELDRMNDTALLSMFNVPAIAPYSSMVR